MVGLPHEKWGETPHAFVVLRRGVAAGEKAIHEFAHANLAGFKTPKAYSFVNRITEDCDGEDSEVRVAWESKRRSPGSYDLHAIRGSVGCAVLNRILLNKAVALQIS